MSNQHTACQYPGCNEAATQEVEYHWWDTDEDGRTSGELVERFCVIHTDVTAAESTNSVHAGVYVRSAVAIGAVR